MTILKMLRVADAFTIANAALGFLAITYIADGKYVLAEVLLLLAVVADGLDGIVARRFGGGKESLGDYLDIMADYLSFCVAPAILFYQLYFDVAATPFATLAQDILVGVAAALLVIGGLLRLARHVAKQGAVAGRFQGLPTTGAGLFVVLLIADGQLGDVFTALLVAGVAALMVTEIPYPKIRGKLALMAGAGVLAVAAIVGALSSGSSLREGAVLAALGGAGAYAVSGLVFTTLRVPLGDRPHDGAHRPAGLPRPPLSRGEITEEFDAEDDDSDELEALYKRMMADASPTKPTTAASPEAEMQESELSKASSEQRRRQVDMIAMTRRLAEREQRLRKLKERLRTEAAAGRGESDNATADRLRELDRRELDLKRREAELIHQRAEIDGVEQYLGEKSAVLERKRAETGAPAATQHGNAKGARRRDDSQEVDPDA